MPRYPWIPLLAASVVAMALARPAAADGAIREAVRFNDFTLAANDDGSTGPVAIGFSLNFFGTTYANLFVNNNGNVTFDAPMSTYTPFPLLDTATPLLAPFFADVDTRAAGSGRVRYGRDILDGRAAFGVNWLDVGYYQRQADRTNSFQLIITDRSDITVGDFDFEFNYDRIEWESGEASGGLNGLGGSSARVGWSNGTNASDELAGSAVNGALLDGGSHALVSGSRRSNVAGRYVWEVRNGQIQQVPAPGAAGLLVAVLLAVAARRTRRR